MNIGQLKKYIYPLIILLLFAVSLKIYYTKQADIKLVNNQLKAQLARNKSIKNNITQLTSQISSDQKTINSKPKTPIYHIGDTQCINGLCITLDSFSNVTSTVCSIGPCLNNIEIWSVKLTVTNNGDYPKIFANVNDIGTRGIFDGSSLRTSDDLFWQPAQGVQLGTFVNAVYDFPMTGQTNTGWLDFEVDSSETVNAYMYGNLIWNLQ